ncbi:MAG: hypothetical protein KY475_21285, partial [Planctomycetes bacterium]|nr:hypothetical protein [Planctomycetota bacterium]
TGVDLTRVPIRPDDIVFGNISGRERHEKSLVIYDYRGEELEVTDYQFVNPESAELFEAEFTPLASEELAEEPDAQGGLKVTVTAKSGLPLGPINQRIRLDLNRSDVPTITADIWGRVVGDFSFIGPGFETDRNRLRLGPIPAGEEVSRQLHVMVKGPYRGDVQLEVAEVTPKGSLEAILGEPREINNGAVIMIPLTVRVPPDAPRGDYLGVGRPAGEIVLRTTHPEVETVSIDVSFIIE